MRPPRFVLDLLARKPWRSDYTRGAAQLAISILVAQFISLVGGMALARLYLPESQDLIAGFTWLINSLMPIVTLRYDVGIVMPKTEASASQLFRISLLCAVAISVLSVPAVAVCGALGWGSWNALLWVPPTLLGLGLTNTFIGWCNRRRWFGMQSTSKIILAALYPIIAAIAWLWNGAQPEHLPAAYGLATVCGAATFAFLLHRTGSLPQLSLKRKRWLPHWRMAVRFRQLPLISVPSYFMNMASVAVLVTSLQWLGAGTSASFNLVFQILRVPSVLLGMAVGQAFTAKAATLVDQPDALRRVTLGTMGTLSLLALPFALVFAWAGPFLFSLVYGEQWRAAGEFSQWLVWGAASGLVTTPLAMLPTLLHANRVQFLLTLGISSARCAVGWLAIKGASARTIVVGATIVDIGAAAIFIGFVFWLLRRQAGSHPPAAPDERAPSAA